MNATVTSAGDTSAAIRALTELVCGFARARDMGGDIQARSFVERAAVGYSGVAGGFLLKPEWADAVIDSARMKDGPFARVNWRGTHARTFKFFSYNELSRQNGKRWGGVSANVGQSENVPMAASQPSLSLIEYDLQRMDIFTQVSRDALADTRLIEPAINYAACSELRLRIDSFLIAGGSSASNTGGIPSGGPAGIVNSPGCVQVNRQTPNTITSIDIDNLWGSIADANSVGLVWHATKPTIAKLDALADAGNIPFNNYFPQGRNGNSTPLLKGRPLIMSEVCNIYGSPCDLCCADWGDYWLYAHMADAKPGTGDSAVPYSSPLAFSISPSAQSGAMGFGAWGMPEGIVESRASDQYAFLTDLVSFGFKLRIDGHFMWNSTRVDINGQTVGPGAWLN